VTRLASALSTEGIDSHLLTLDYPGVGPMEQASRATVHAFPARWLARHLRGWSRPMRSELERLASTGVDVIHSHGLWMFPNFYARQSAVNNGIPLVISPRGMLDTWSLQHNWRKKRLAWAAFERANLASARLFHVTSAAERSAVRDLGFSQPVALIPNGVELPELSALPPRDVIAQRFPELVEREWLVFMSRLHPKKGVSKLLQAWIQLAPRFSDWQLIVAGPDLDGHGEMLRREAAAAGIAPRVTFTGMLAGIEKSCLLGNADLFVLPTHSENFGIVIAEALAHGVPVVTTRAAPWAELETRRCGWWIADSAPELTTTLDMAMRLSVMERAEMGKRGRQLMETRYSWTSTGRQLASVYAWLLDIGAKPECVL
jgi:glycosyltransferase involved in cell wall biosynthesis